MAKKVQRGGEAEPDGPRQAKGSDQIRHDKTAAEKPADRGEGKISPRTSGKAEGE